MELLTGGADSAGAATGDERLPRDRAAVLQRAEAAEATSRYADAAAHADLRMRYCGTRPKAGF